MRSDSFEVVYIWKEKSPHWFRFSWVQCECNNFYNI